MCATSWAVTCCRWRPASNQIRGGPLPDLAPGRSGQISHSDHDRYQRTPDGWKFTERVYEVRYLDTTPLAGSAPQAAGAPADPPTGDKAAAMGGR